MSVNSLALEQKEIFYDTHGAHVLTSEGYIVFRDGAQDENSSTGLGRLIEPPTDEYERLSLIARYHGIIAQQAAQEFEDYRNHLQGNGRGVPGLYTPEEKLQYLRDLQVEARRTRAKFARAKRDAEGAMPDWLREDEQYEAEKAAQDHEFMSQVDNIKL